jgi:Mn2+/Fe2+ NRAMP family transporter
MSYAIPIFLKVTVSRNTFEQGPFNLGKWSNFIGWISVIWLMGTNVIFFFPTVFNDDL